MDEIVQDYCGGNGDVAALVAGYRRGAQGRATPPPPPRPPRQPMRQVAPRLAHATYFDSTAALSSSGSCGSREAATRQVEIESREPAMSATSDNILWLQ